MVFNTFDGTYTLADFAGTRCIFFDSIVNWKKKIYLKKFGYFDQTGFFS